MMADEYIKRSDAIETLMQMCWHDGDGYPVEDADEKRQYAEDWVNAMPSADVQPVVRCKDCEYYREDKHGYCSFFDEKFMPFNGYCSNGVKMDGET